MVAKAVSGGHLAVLARAAGDRKHRSPAVRRADDGVPDGDPRRLPRGLLGRDLGDLGSRRAGKLYEARSRLYRSRLVQSLESSRRDLHNALHCTVL